MAASEPNPAFWGKRSMVSFIFSPFSVSADVLFASASAEIGIEHSSSAKAQHIIFRQAVQRWTGSYQIRMLELAEAEILDQNQIKVTFLLPDQDFGTRSNMRRLREHLKIATFSMNRTPIHHFSLTDTAKLPTDKEYLLSSSRPQLFLNKRREFTSDGEA